MDLLNLRRWFALNKDVIKIRGMASRIELLAKKPLGETMMNRILTEDLDQQREPSKKILPHLFSVAESFGYSPTFNYLKK